MIRTYTRFIQNIDQIKVDVPATVSYGTRGGILLSIEFTWVPFTFQVEEPDVPRGGNIWVLVGDTSGNRPILGQTIDSAGSAIVMTAGSVYEWTHPFRSTLQDADPVISKLATVPGKEPIGAFNGFIQIVVQPGTPPYYHSLSYTVTVLEYE